VLRGEPVETSIQLFMPIFSLDRSGPDGFFKGKADGENIGLIRKIVQNNQRRSK
jgi:hypothetical protein